jgi:hypothetical protein
VRETHVIGRCGGTIAAASFAAILAGSVIFFLFDCSD